MDRKFIQRSEFPVVRRGFDPDEVKRHLSAIAEAVNRELNEIRAGSTVSGAAAGHVRAIVEAAERSAAEIVEKAEREAEETTAAAAAAARAKRERADARAIVHVERVEGAGRELLERADRTEAEIDRLVEGFRSAGDALVDRLRGGVATIQSKLDEIRAELPDLAAAEVEESDEPLDDDLQREEGDTSEEELEELEAVEDEVARAR